MKINHLNGGMRESFVSEYNPILDKIEYMYVDNKIIAIAFSIECLTKLVGRSLMHLNDIPATLVPETQITHHGASNEDMRC